MVPVPSYQNLPTFGGGATLVQPIAGTYNGGFLPGQLFPAEYENWLMNFITANSNTSETSVLSMSAELVNILTAASLTPIPATNTQVKQALDLLYAPLAGYNTLNGFFSFTAGKVLTVQNSLTLLGVDGKTLNLQNSLKIDNNLEFAGNNGSVITFKGTGNALTTADALGNVTHAGGLTGTSTTVGTMAGIGSTITPVSSTRIMFMIAGGFDNGTINDGLQLRLRYGTGPAPANGDAVSGTIIGFAFNFQGQSQTFCIPAIVTGLSLGTAYWFDVDIVCTGGGTGVISNLNALAIEV